MLSLDVGVLYRYGGHLPAAVAAGEWWRLFTAVFLHVGLWHLGFNLMALSQVGPPLEEIHGRGRLLVLFLLMGGFANLASGWMGISGISAGASGAIMGLIGLAGQYSRKNNPSRAFAYLDQ